VWKPDVEQNERIVFNMTPREEAFCRALGGTITADNYFQFIRLAGVPDHADV